MPGTLSIFFAYNPVSDKSLKGSSWADFSKENRYSAVQLEIQQAIYSDTGQKSKALRSAKNKNYENIFQPLSSGKIVFYLQF